MYLGCDRALFEQSPSPCSDPISTFIAVDFFFFIKPRTCDVQQNNKPKHLLCRVDDDVQSMIQASWAEISKC